MEHGQLCPLAKASEILAERWTLLVIRQLLSGDMEAPEAAICVGLFARDCF